MQRRIEELEALVDSREEDRALLAEALHRVILMISQQSEEDLPTLTRRGYGALIARAAIVASEAQIDLDDAVYLWTVDSTDETLGTPVGIRSWKVHPPSQCYPGPCPVHFPTEHAMSGWEKLWRADSGVLERICVHGFGHPDPDQFRHWRDRGTMHLSAHDCDGCCPVREKQEIEAGGSDASE